MSESEKAAVGVNTLKSAGKWLLYATLFLFALLALAVGAVFAYSKWEARLQPIAEIGRIRLGDTMGDVEFKIQDLEPYEIEDLNQTFDSSMSSDSKRILVFSKNNIVKMVGYLCQTEGTDYTRVGQINCAASGEEIQKRYGDSIRIRCRSDEGKANNRIRIYEAMKYGVRYTLIQNSVVYVSVVDPIDLEAISSQNWIPCQ